MRYRVDKNDEQHIFIVHFMQSAQWTVRVVLVFWQIERFRSILLMLFWVFFSLIICCSYSFWALFVWLGRLRPYSFKASTSITIRSLRCSTWLAARFCGFSIATPGSIEAGRVFAKTWCSRGGFAVGHTCSCYHCSPESIKRMSALFGQFYWQSFLYSIFIFLHLKKWVRLGHKSMQRITNTIIHWTHNAPPKRFTCSYIRSI